MIKPGTKVSKEKRALENVFMYARRMRNRAAKHYMTAEIERWDTILRFCQEGGCLSSVLRKS